MKLEDLGLDQDMLAGNTDIELLIVQGDGKEVRATLNTNLLCPDDLKKDTSKQVTSTPILRADNTGTSELRPYKCSMCPRTFKFYKTFRCHEIVHTKSDIFTCHLCKRVFARETNLASHLELHQKKAAMSTIDFQHKMKEKREKEDLDKNHYKCELCFVIFDDYNKLKNHTLAMHDQELTSICTFCDKTFSSKEYLNKHLLVHMGPFTCCDTGFANREMYTNHLKTLHPKKLLDCSVCHKVMLNKSDFTSHVKYVHANETVEVRQALLDSLFDAQCTSCGKKMMSQQISWHMRDVHGAEDIKCPYCPYLCNMEFKLKKHIKVDHQKEDNRCEKCSKDFPGLQDLIEHLKIEHMDPYQCSECISTFDTRSLMEKHQFDNHNIWFFCKKCDKRFAYSAELKQHFTEHEPGKQTYLCEDCGTGFETKPQLKMHLVKDHYSGDNKEMLKFHPDMKAVAGLTVCQICGESDFNSKLSFSKHISLIHFNGSFEAACKVLPFLKQFPSPLEAVKCNTCGKTFSHMVYLKMHIKTHLAVPTVKKPKKPPVKRVESDSDDDDDDKVDFSNIEPRDTADKFYKCQKCSAHFARKAALEKHITSKHKKDLFKEALKVIEKEETARAEAEEERDKGKKGTELSKSPRKIPKKHICKACEEIFKTKTELQKHIEEVHSEMEANDTKLGEDGKEFNSETNTCNSCNKSFASGLNLRRHMLKQHQILIPESEESTSTKKSRAIEETKQPERTPEVSEKRGRGRPTGSTKKKIAEDRRAQLKKDKQKKKESIDRDMSVDSDDDAAADYEEPAAADDITAFLGRNFNLSKKDSDDSGAEGTDKKRKYKCQTCGKAFSREATLRKHEAFHEESDELDGDAMDTDDLQTANYCCPTCSNMYSTASGLVFHNRSKHPDVDEEQVLNYIEEVDKKIKILEATSDKIATPTKGKKRKLSSDLSTWSAKREKIEGGEYTQSGRRITKSAKRNEQVQCGFCKKYFDVEASLRRHVLMAHTDRTSPVKSAKKKRAAEDTDGEHACPVCPKTYDLEVNLRRHMLMKHKMNLDDVVRNESGDIEFVGSNGYTCDICCEEFAIQSALSDHLSEVHDEGTASKTPAKSVSLKCEQCEVDFANLQSLNLHMRQHTGERPYKCSVCQDNYISKFQLDRHLTKQHETELSTTVKCKICLALFDTERGMKKHRDSHRKDVDSTAQAHKCQECEKVYTWKNNLVSHQKNFHDNDEKVCGICNKIFPDEKSIQIHMKKHKETPDGKFDCKYCGKQFAKGSALRMHETVSHKMMGVATLSCDICKKSFMTKGSLLEHMLSHTSIMPFKCNKCANSFKSENALKTHKCDSKSITSPRKPQRSPAITAKKDAPVESKTSGAFGCTKCKKTFFRLWQLNAHRREAHKGLYMGMTLAKRKKDQEKSSMVQTRRQSATSNSETDDKKIIKTKNLTKMKEKKMPKLVDNTTVAKDVNAGKTTPKLSIKKTKPRLSLKPGSDKAMPKLKAEGKISKLKNLKMRSKGMKPFLKTKGLILKSKNVAKAKMRPVLKAPMPVLQAGKHGKIPPPNKRPVPCPICSKILSKRSHLKTHIRNVHKMDPDEVMKVPTTTTSPEQSTKRVKCRYCNECAKMYWSQQQYEAHLHEKHPDKVAIELDKQVMQHIKQEVMSPRPETAEDKDGEETDSVPHKCEFCPEVFWTKSGFEKHIVIFHPDHIDEYDLSPEVLATSEPQIELVNDNLDSENFLSVEVYQNIACEKLSSSPVVMIEKISKNYRVDSEKKDQMAKGTTGEGEKNIDGKEEEFENTEDSRQEMEYTEMGDVDTSKRSDKDVSGTSSKLKTLKEIEEQMPEALGKKFEHEHDTHNKLELMESNELSESNETEKENIDEIQKAAMEMEMDFDEDIVPIDFGHKVDSDSADQYRDQSVGFSSIDDSVSSIEQVGEENTDVGALEETENEPTAVIESVNESESDQLVEMSEPETALEPEYHDIQVVSEDRKDYVESEVISEIQVEQEDNIEQSITVEQPIDNEQTVVELDQCESTIEETAVGDSSGELGPGPSEEVKDFNIDLESEQNTDHDVESTEQIDEVSEIAEGDHKIDNLATGTDVNFEHVEDEPDSEDNKSDFIPSSHSESVVQQKVVNIESDTVVAEESEWAELKSKIVNGDDSVSGNV